MKKRSHTKTAFLWLILPIIYVAAFFVSLGITYLLGKDSGEWAGLISSSVSAVLMMFFPIVQISCATASAIHQIKALRAGEPRYKNLIMTFVSILYILIALLFANMLWQGMMSI